MVSDSEPLPTVEVFSSLECPYAYLAVYRLRQVWPEFAGRVQIVWRALSLEYINQESNPKPGHENELAFLSSRIEPGLPYHPWNRSDWEWPGTLWPAFEALAGVQAQSPVAAFEFSWTLRHALFAESRNLALRHELFELAHRTAQQVDLDLGRFEADWDAGKHKQSVIADSRRGWHELQVEGSPTFILSGGRQISNPGMGEINFDEKNNVLHSFQPYPGNPLDAYREMLGSLIG